MAADEAVTEHPDQSVLYTLPPPPETILSVRNLTLVANRSGSKLVRKFKARRRRRGVQGEKIGHAGEKADGHAADLRPGKGVHQADIEDGGGTPNRGYVGEDGNDRPIEEEEDKEDEDTEKTDDGRKIILNDVSCECYPREMLAM